MKTLTETELKAACEEAWRLGFLSEHSFVKDCTNDAGFEVIPEVLGNCDLPEGTVDSLSDAEGVVLVEAYVQGFDDSFHSMEREALREALAIAVSILRDADRCPEEIGQVSAKYPPYAAGTCLNYEELTEWQKVADEPISG